METQPRGRKLIYTIGVVLVIICLVQGWVIYRFARKNSPDSSIFKDIDSFSTFLDHKFGKEKQENRQLFDRFFNNDFFSNQSDPFKEIDRMQKQMEKMLRENHRGMFQNSWQDWFGHRFLGDKNQIDISTKELDDKYIVTVSIPNLKDNKLNIDVEQYGITISGKYSQMVENKNAQGDVISKSQMHQSIYKRIPIPEDADYQKAQIDQQKDRIVITLPKK